MLTGARRIFLNRVRETGDKFVKILNYVKNILI